MNGKLYDFEFLDHIKQIATSHKTKGDFYGIQSIFD